LNPEFRARIETADLVISAVDDEGEVRAIELRSHPFYVATLFQPELKALRGELHPLIKAFVQACC